MDRPIIALATPPLKGALAVIRTSGEGVFAITDELFSKKISGIKERGLFFGTMHNAEGKRIDQVVILAYPGPKTMTGEDVVEIIPHGSMLIVNEIIEAYEAKGCSYATRGEFSSRAFYNGKMDLVEAEAVNDLINATTIESKDLALKSLSGEASKLLKPIKDRIASLMALIEVGIDFPEYTDVEEASAAKIAKESKEIKKDVDALIDDAHDGQIIKGGVNVAIVGEPNVGKSSILNALLEEEKAIVSDIPGTTRDIVEGDISVHGVPLHLLDTAGIRASKDKIEEIGVTLSEKSIERADVVVLVLSAAENQMSQKEKEIVELAKGKRLILCYNKEDLAASKDEKKLYVSALNKNVEPLKEEIYKTLNLSEESFSKPSLSNPRQIGLLRQISENMREVSIDADNNAPMDLLSVNLQAAYHAAQDILGEAGAADVQDEIFSRFCVGK
ncbi:MAG: tRNA uridine-5-carboxymethylaminomethyl(34) synthesis GTPase MnmE [Bacilli bacterium]|nr:tRNA uridine-5-carboxymethylaminomethyl(34) synthesis GTPase MnmE [Bacilli bacterium]